MNDFDERVSALHHAVVSSSAVTGDIARSVGSLAAETGFSLREVFDRVARLGDAPLDPLSHAEIIREAALGWADTFEAFCVAQSCEDPLTGLASPAHLRSRLETVYRAAERDGVSIAARHALVVAELPLGTTPLGGDLRALDVGEILRSVFTGDEVFARLHARRVAVLAHRPGCDALTVGLASRLLARKFVDVPHRLWVEELPASLDDLSWTLSALSGSS